MEQYTWQIKGNSAVVRGASFSATVDLARPDLGLQNISRHGKEMKGSILGVAIESGVEGRTADKKHNEGPIESYVRGNELVATYAPTVDEPVGFQVYWEIQDNAKDVVTIDATVSVQTPLLETYPKVLVRTTIASTGLEFHRSTAIDGQQARVEGEDWTVRQCGFSLAELVPNDGKKQGFYTEMVHPTDFLDCRLATSGDRSTESQWRMCDHFMEKGVIRRLRARAVFAEPSLDKEAACNIAKQQLESLATEQPPLTT